MATHVHVNLKIGALVGVGHTFLRDFVFSVDAIPNFDFL
jgi:hypothetical protein